MVVLEAWSYGLPVLMTPQCNIPDGFEKGAAIPVETNSKDIARGLCKLIEMGEADRLEMGQRGMKIVQDEFSWSTIAPRMHQVYEWLLGGGTPPDCVYSM